MTIREEEERLIFRPESDSSATIKAVLFIGITLSCLTILGIVSLFAGRTSGQDVLAPRGNLAGFMWAFTTVVMLMVIPWYLSKLQRPALALEFLRRDKTVRRGGSIVTRFERIEFLEVSESRDVDGRYSYTLTLVYGEGQKLLLEQSYDEKGQLTLADRLAAYIGTQVRSAPAPMLT